MSSSEYSKSYSINNNSKTGILLLHGFTGVTYSLNYIIEKFNKDKYNIEAPCLPGHGTHWKDLGKVKYNDWINESENSFNKIKKHSKSIFIIGLSMGGLLALQLANKYSNIEGIILINHSIFVSDPRFKFVPIFRFFSKSGEGISNDIKDKKQDEHAYTTISTEGAYQFYKLINSTKKIIKNIETPTLIFKSVEDHVILFKSAGYTYDKLKSNDKEIIWLKNSYHVATLDFDKEIIYDRSQEFIQKILKKQS